MYLVPFILCAAAPPSFPRAVVTIPTAAPATAAADRMSPASQLGNLVDGLNPIRCGQSLCGFDSLLSAEYCFGVIPPPNPNPYKGLKIGLN